MECCVPCTRVCASDCARGKQASAGVVHAGHGCKIRAWHEHTTRQQYTPLSSGIVQPASLLRYHTHSGTLSGCTTISACRNCARCEYSTPLGLPVVPLQEQEQAAVQLSKQYTSRTTCMQLLLVREHNWVRWTPLPEAMRDVQQS